MRYRLFKFWTVFGILLGFSFSGNCEEQSGWCYTQTTQQCFYMLESIEVDGVAPTETDIIGAFKSVDLDSVEGNCSGGILDAEEGICKVCVGWIEADPEGYTSVLALGDDGSDFSDLYLQTGDIPELYLYDSSEDDVLELFVPGMTDSYGFSNNEIYIIPGVSYANNTLGCEDPNACNTDEFATSDDGSCIYPPSNISIVASATQNEILIEWNDPLGTGPFTHELNVITGDGFSYYNDNAISPISLSDLDWSTTYFIELITHNECEDICSSCEPLITQTSEDTESMPAPEQMVIESIFGLDGSVYIQWTPVNQEYESIYRIYSNGELIDSTATTSYNHIDLSPEATNTYQLQAVNQDALGGELSDPIESSTLPLHTATLDEVFSGQGQLQLTWSISHPNSELLPDENMYNGYYYQYDVYMDGEYFVTRNSSSLIVSNLSPGQSYCFFVVPKLEPYNNDDSSMFLGMESNQICAIPDEISGWKINIEGFIDLYGMYPTYDSFNELGMIPETTTDGYDAEFDLFEPPPDPSQWVSVSFPHPEWLLGLGEDFTSDFREYTDLLVASTTWDVEIESDLPGIGHLNFNFTELDDFPVYLELSSDLVYTDSDLDSENSQYYNIADGVNVDIIYSEENIKKPFKIIVGNNPPLVPTGFIAEGGIRLVDISWDSNEPCTFNEHTCNDFSNRYPATGFKLFRRWIQDTEDRLLALLTSSGSKISLIPVQLGNGSTEESFQFIQEPSNGALSIEYLEEYIDDNHNDTYDLGEEFFDCGLDGICPNDLEYIAPDLGEGDERCNIAYFYSANENFIGLDSLVYENNLDESRTVNIVVSDLAPSSYRDENLYTGTLYEYDIIPTNISGDGPISSVGAAAVTSQNIRPVADAGVDSKFYIIDPYAMDAEITVPQSSDGIFENNSYDPDGLQGEPLLYEWQMCDSTGVECGLLEDSNPIVSYDLSEDVYQFVLRVQDISLGWSEPDTVRVEVDSEIPPPAQVSFIDQTTSFGLYHNYLDWPVSSYGQENWPSENYNGPSELATTYFVVRDDSVIATLSSDVTDYIDNGLFPSTEYCYYVYSVNTQGNESLPSDIVCLTTGDQPSVQVISPNGGEILTSGELQEISWSPVGAQYIDSTFIYWSIDGGDQWSLLEEFDGLYVAYDFQVPETETLLFSNLFKIEILDVGDYYGIDKQSYNDVSDNLVIIANNNLSHNYSSGVHMISTPLELYTTNIEETFNGLDDNFPSYWSVYDELGNNNEFMMNFLTGNGYYLLNGEDATLGLEGDILEESSIVLHEGWNMIGNPLVARVIVDSLKVSVAGSEEIIEWSDAVLSGLVSPSVHGFNNDLSMHIPDQILNPFFGYWINSSSDSLELIVQPHIYDESFYVNEREDLWSLTLKAQENEISTIFSMSDIIKIGMAEDATDGFRYGEDEYDLPVVFTPVQYTNMYIDHGESGDWYSQGQIDDNGILISDSKFYSDIRSFTAYEERQDWFITGKLLGTLTDSDQILLTWEMDDIDQNYDVYLFAGDQIQNMRDADSLVVSGYNYEDMRITVGPQEIECEDLGQVTCADGTCADSGEECENELSNNLIPYEFSISELYPNPFNPSTSIDIAIPHMERVDIRVYDINGSLIDVIYSDFLSSGFHTFNWDASIFTSGIYFIQVKTSDFNKVMKSILIK